jgi:hypothetical protein
MVDAEVRDWLRRQTVLVTDRNKFTVSDGVRVSMSAEQTFTLDPGPPRQPMQSQLHYFISGQRERSCDSHRESIWDPMRQITRFCASNNPLQEKVHDRAEDCGARKRDDPREYDTHHYSGVGFAGR